MDKEDRAPLEDMAKNFFPFMEQMFQRVLAPPQNGQPPQYAAYAQHINAILVIYRTAQRVSAFSHLQLQLPRYLLNFDKLKLMFGLIIAVWKHPMPK